jgi:hypothetical protein
MGNTSVIIFSKNRTFQLFSLIKSLNHYSDIQESDIYVLCKTDLEAISYSPLKDKFSSIFVEEKNFLSDIKHIVQSCGSSYILFLVDDIIFKGRFSIRQIEDYMDIHADVDSFSLRLGKNIRQGTSPHFVHDNGILTWQTSRDLGLSWKYFWEVSSSLYRIDLVQAYLEKCDPVKVGYPNPFESYYYRVMPSFIDGGGVKGLAKRIRFFLNNKINKMASFEQSKCFTQGVNLVAERAIEYKTLFDPVDLHGKMEEGCVIDFYSIKDVENNKPNMGAVYFKIIKDIETAVHQRKT